MATETHTEGTVAELEDADFDRFVQNNELVVIDFWAPWCGPCKRVEPVVKELASELAGKVAFAKVNTDENPATAQKFGIMSLPTLMVMKNGSVVDQVVGAMPKPQLQQKLSKHL